MNRRKFLTGTAGLIGAGSITATAYNSQTTEREIDIGVEADDAADAMVLLEPGPAEGTVIENNMLRITGEVDDGDARITPRGTFDFGDKNAPTSTYAFSITNNIESQREFALQTSVEPEEAGINIALYDADGNEIGSSFEKETLSNTQSTNGGEVQLLNDDPLSESEEPLQVVASIPNEEDITVEITVFEDTDGDGDANLQQTISIDDGANGYSLDNLELEEGNEVWIELDSTVDGDNEEEDDYAEIEEITIDPEHHDGDGDEDTSVVDPGEAFFLAPGEVAYAVLSIETLNDDTNIEGTVQLVADTEIDAETL